MKQKDVIIIALIIVIISLTAWNSRYELIPTPSGYNWYNQHGMVFLYPKDLILWEVVVHEDGSFDSSMPVSEDIGTVGWNSGNTNIPQPETTHWIESSVIWIRKEATEDLDLHLFYNQLYANAERNQREINLTKGEIEPFVHRKHQGRIQFFNYTTQTIGTDEWAQIYGVVAGFYCDETKRMIEIYYIDIYDENPVYDKESLLNEFNFILESLNCH